MNRAKQGNRISQNIFIAGFILSFAFMPNLMAEEGTWNTFQLLQTKIMTPTKILTPTSPRVTTTPNSFSGKPSSHTVVNEEILLKSIHILPEFLCTKEPSCAAGYVLDTSKKCPHAISDSPSECYLCYPDPTVKSLASCPAGMKLNWWFGEYACKNLDAWLCIETKGKEIPKEDLTPELAKTILQDCVAKYPVIVPAAPCPDKTTLQPINVKELALPSELEFRCSFSNADDFKIGTQCKTISSMFAPEGSENGQVECFHY